MSRRNRLTIDGKVALITGGSRGIGRAIALRLARDGAKIAVNYKSNEEAAKWVVDAVAEMGGEAMAVAADVAQSTEVENMVNRVVDAWGGVDILVNNAGIIHDGLLMRMPEEVWDEVINTNLKGTYNCTKEVLRFMVRKRWGRVINVVSVVGLEGNPGQSNYAASKAGVVAFSRSIAKEVASRNITVNSVAPGYIATEIVADLSPEFKELIFSRIPQNRFGTVDDVANMVGYLASEEANYITGEVIRVDGGIEL
jgi:3-oxoacyl-[acyl-carrier protein] reductase